MGKQIFVRTRKVLSISFIILFALSMGTALVSAQPQSTKTTSTTPGCEYGPDTCIQGYVWREAKLGDHVCVTPEVRDQTRRDNAMAHERRTSGEYGPNTCKSGYVWREAFPGDVVCVDPQTRTDAKQDNSYAPYRKSCQQ